MTEIYKSNYYESVYNMYTLDNNYELKQFINNLTEEEILTYVPFDKEAYDNTIGLGGSETVEKEIEDFKSNLRMTNIEPKVNNHHYFYLVHDNEIIGKATLRINISGPCKNLFFEFFYLSDPERNKGLGTIFFVEVLKMINKTNHIDEIKCQVSDVNISMIKLLEKLNFSK